MFKSILSAFPCLSVADFEVLTIKAIDLDQPGSANSDVHYKILNQEPKLPNAELFAINPVSGVIRVKSQGLDREVWTCDTSRFMQKGFHNHLLNCKRAGILIFLQEYPEYNLEVQAADMEGEGLTVRGKVVITVTDSNDNAPAFHTLQASTRVKTFHSP